MRSSPEELIQRAVHAVETGDYAPWLRRSLVIMAILAIALIHLYNFRGLAASQAMDQAQIGRALATSHGWYTNVVRPRAIGQLQEHGKDVRTKIWLDTYNAPLPPLVNAVGLFPVRSHVMSSKDVVYIGDRIIAVMAMMFFLGSVVILFFTARRLFDHQLALLCCALMLLCDMFWEYSLSGLPQMLLLFLFSATIYALVRAVEARYSGGRVGPWLVAIGVGFGLLALTHALTIWMFLGALAFFPFFFRPRYAAAGVVLAAFLVIYTPWLIRNYIACGNPAGIAIYSALDGIRRPESAWMRRVTFDSEGIGPAVFRDKIIENLISQMGHIVEYFGWSVVALMFFSALLHPFKRKEVSVIRWMLLVMWGGAVFGMALFGISEEQGVAANQLHLLFVPLMTCYGLAYLLVQWNRLGINLRLARAGFISGLFLLCSLPLVTSLCTMVFGSIKTIVRWPPYSPPYISIMNGWMKPEEIIASDMPWAVAWYAGRRSVWVPDTVKAFSDLNDYDVLGGRINALFLTPISGSQNKFGDILKGEYKEWAPAIQRTVVIEKFPLKWGTYLGFDEYLFFSDRDRTRIATP